MEPAAYATVLETVIRYKTKLSTFRAYNTSLRCPLSCLITLWQKIKLIVELKFLNQMHAKEIFAIVGNSLLGSVEYVQKLQLYLVSDRNF